MNEKLDIYDILSTLVLGILAVCWIPICFPDLLAIKAPKYPDAFAVLALSASALFAGQLIQAMASSLEPLLYQTFGGRPSDIALDKGLGDRYLSAKTATRVKEKLKVAIGEDEADNQRIFFFAMQKSEGAGIGRAARFNGLYAYHRGLLVLMLFVICALLASAQWGAAASWPASQTVPLYMVSIALLVLFWFRAKQRAYYYVREVLLTAERVVDEKIATTKPPETPPKA